MYRLLPPSGLESNSHEERIILSLEQRQLVDNQLYGHECSFNCLYVLSLGIIQGVPGDAPSLSLDTQGYFSPTQRACPFHLCAPVRVYHDDPPALNISYKGPVWQVRRSGPSGQQLDLTVMSTLIFSGQTWLK